MNPFLKYLLFQVPGWLIGAVLLVWLWPMSGLAPWIAVLGYAIWVAKDFVLWPWLRSAYESPAPLGVQSLVGACGVTQGALSRRGYVRIAGELWEAEVPPGDLPLPPGAAVRVVRAERMTLVVVPADSARR